MSEFASALDSASIPEETPLPTPTEPEASSVGSENLLVGTEAPVSLSASDKKPMSEAKRRAWEKCQAARRSKAPKQKKKKEVEEANQPKERVDEAAIPAPAPPVHDTQPQIEHESSSESSEEETRLPRAARKQITRKVVKVIGAKLMKEWNTRSKAKRKLPPIEENSESSSSDSDSPPLRKRGRETEEMPPPPPRLTRQTAGEFLPVGDGTFHISFY